ncbi:MAG: phytanoyl-CoA dioxygenase family protein [Alphaproteobacteria bacterium]|jgi:ectoine hydroxylase-related dioxygenase (phytanoyl-CoA dioxygenase family)|nr:hypothetical protein [Rhodospirillaceae bacterium]MDG2483014.1 phytanoyl-CoA dioxygenase family protein [Alphaproteobacteria bacterium]MBT6205961.1 hypothetical protein [Rhodospirillaceae bacterium]MBT6510261.1 hypothetical protein [Rhodospirillaceae bacterium]MBT7612067.1 hypothetical protein [Rhodospirillaceae bacterium]
MPVRHFSPDAAPDAMLEELRSNGVIVVDNMIDDAVMDRFMDELAPHMADAPLGGGEFFGGAMKRVQEVAAKAPSIAGIIADPTLVALGDAVLLENCKSYRIQVLAILEIWKGGKTQPLHRDFGVYEPYIMHEPGAKEILLSWIVAGTDFTKANGATRVVPGSHTWPLDRVARDHEVEIAEMPRGSGLIYLGSVLHGARINNTDQPRTGIVSGYAVGWLRQEENQYLSCPPEAAAKLPKLAQQLLGYRAHSPVLGRSGDRDTQWLLGPKKVDIDADGYKDQSLQEV